MCDDQPVWVLLIASIAPCLGIITEVVYYCFIKGCSPGKKKILRYFLRGFSLVNWVVCWGSAIVFIVACEQSSVDVFGIFKVTPYLFIGIMAACWACMMFESWYSDEWHCLKRMDNSREIIERIEEMTNSAPKIEQKVIGYNIEREGCQCWNKTMSILHCQVKFHSSKNYQYNYWVDFSDKAVKARKSVITRIKLREEILNDNATEEDMERDKNELRDRDKTDSKVHDYVADKSVPHFKKWLAIDDSEACNCPSRCGGCGNCSWCVRECCTPILIGKTQFWLASALTLTWPYRLLFMCLTVKKRYLVGKGFYKDWPVKMKREGYVVRKPGVPVRETGQVKMVWLTGKRSEPVPEPIQSVSYNVEMGTEAAKEANSNPLTKNCCSRQKPS